MISGFHSDGVIMLFRGGLCATFFIYFGYVGDYTRASKKPYYPFEYHFILLAAFLALQFMTISGSFVTLFLAIELFSVCMYYLINLTRVHTKGLESGVKYFAISSYGSATYLFGLFMIFLSGDLSDPIRLYMLSAPESFIEIGGIYFIVAALFIKIGAGLYYF